MLQITSLSKTVILTTPLTTPLHEQYRTTANKDQHALIIIIFRLSVMKLVDDLRGDFHHSEQGRSSCPCHNKNPIFVVFLCCGYSAVAVLVDISVMGITISASCPPASAIFRFSLSSASYRAGLRQWLFPKESTG